MSLTCVSTVRLWGVGVMATDLLYIQYLYRKQIINNNLLVLYIQVA